MPPKKRKQNSAAPVRRNNRRSPVPTASDLPSQPAKSKSAPASQNAKDRISSGGDKKRKEVKDESQQVHVDVMHTITHHTSFVPMLASLPVELHSTNGNTTIHASAHGSYHGNANSLAANDASAAVNSGNSYSNSNININSRPYALYHPRNLGLIPPTITHPQEGAGKVVIPHSAGCRMKYLPEPTFRTLPVHPDYNNEEYIVMSGLTCPTVINNSHSSSGQLAIGDTGGNITLYATLPTFMPIHKLQSSASRRFAELNPIGRQKKKKRIGRSQAIVGSSIDRNNAIETIVLLPNTRRVMVGTTMEIECISFENEIQWTMTWPWHIDYKEEEEVSTSAVERILGWDGLEDKRMMRGIPMRLNGNRGGDFVLASFAFFPIKNAMSEHLKSNCHSNDGDGNNEGDEEDHDSDNDNGKHRDQLQHEQQTQLQRPELFSPILKINAITGEFTNVVPMEEIKEVAVISNEIEPTSASASEPQWKECIIGSRAMAIFDQLNFGHVIGVFLTHGPPCITTSTTTTVDTIPTVMQELMVLDENYHILHRTKVPTKSSGSKIIAVEAINQSPHGDFTIAANAKGGVRVYRTNGLQLLGAYGEGVSLHGHSIVWQDIFFMRIDSNRSEENDEGKQEHWGQILERTDELTHRGKYEKMRSEKNKMTDLLNQLYIVSVPSAFREPVDMKEHIQFWDVSKIEFDGGNKLPSFELLAPKKSEGICNLIYDDSIMTSNSGRFLMSTHAGDCFEMTPTLATDWAGQMYPTGYLVIDNNIAYIEDEDELDQVVDSHVEQGDFCQTISPNTKLQGKQDEAELKMVLQMSMQDELVDVIGNDGDDWRNSVVNVAPCRPQAHLRVKTVTEKEKNSPGEGGADDNSNPKTLFDLIKTLPSYDAVKKELAADKELVERRQSLIEEAKLRMNDEPIKIPRRKQGNVDFVINASIDKKLTVKFLEKIGQADGSGSMFQMKPKEQDCANYVAWSKENDCAACQGRFVIHICGKRATPIDYDAIASAERIKQEKEEAEKKEVQTEKRKLAEQRRKDKKLKNKEEEERLQKEQEEAEREENEASLDLTVKSGDDHHNETYGQPDVTFPLGHDQSSPQQMVYQYEEANMHSSNDQYVRENHDQHVNSSSMHKTSLYDQPRYDRAQYSYQELPGSTSFFSHPRQYGSENPPSHDQEQYSSTTSIGAMNFGDSMLSNIPSLPSEPTSYYPSNSNSGQDGSHYSRK
jgi:hypothetical protein